MQSPVRHLWTSLRADIAAMLMIAFIFQLLTPVIVLANPTADGDSAFENALRASICRVDISEPSDTDTPSTTDRFVCELCVLCHVDISDRIDLLPEVVSYQHPAGPTQPKRLTDQRRLSRSLLARPSVPRAPPA